MNAAADFRVERAGAAHVAALSALFERTNTPCHCEWWHFAGDKNAWLERCFQRPEENRAALRARLEDGAAELHGFVALGADGAALGWMKLTAAERVGKLYDQRLYRGLPCFAGDRRGVLTIGCFLIEEAARRRGVASALLRAGVEHGLRSGARAIEAFPRGAAAEGSLRDDELWTGPEKLFERFGFRAVTDFSPYPVLRLELTQSR